MIILQDIRTHDRDRSDAFRDFARARAKGKVMQPPLSLPQEERRLHVRRTLREDHQFRIRNRPAGAQAKFDKLADDPFSFFRGTALLYYRDYAGTDGHLPTVFTVGDVHPENFGVMPNEDGAPFFGVNDFDEACFAPFSYDVKRGAVGFYMAARENGLKKKKCRKVVRDFVEGYLEGLREFARDDREKWHELRLDNSPAMIRELLSSAGTDRASFLKGLIHMKKERFKASDEIVPHSRYLDKFQGIVDDYVKNNEITRSGHRDGFFKVKDVAIKKGSGTASLGLGRYYVLIDGPSDAVTDDIVLELKQCRRSALRGLVPEQAMPEGAGPQADTILAAHRVHLVGGDPYYGRVSLDDQDYLVRERSPFKDDIDVEDLDQDELREYARICGKTLSQTHARSDEDTGVMEGDAEKRILSSVHPKVFRADVQRFAAAAAKRIYRDHALYREDHAVGAFTFVNDDDA